MQLTKSKWRNDPLKFCFVFLVPNSHSRRFPGISRKKFLEKDNFFGLAWHSKLRMKTTPDQNLVVLNCPSHSRQVTGTSFAYDIP